MANFFSVAEVAQANFIRARYLKNTQLYIRSCTIERVQEHCWF